MLTYFKRITKAILAPTSTKEFIRLQSETQSEQTIFDHYDLYDALG